MPAPASFEQPVMDLHGRGGHDHFEAIFRVKPGIEQEDVLGAGANVKGKDFHKG